jgi:hypothetical protein
MVVAIHRTAANQLHELIACRDAAAPGIGVVVDAVLVEFGRIDAIEPIGDIIEMDRIAVPHDRVCGEGWACDKHQSYDGDEG